MMRFISSLFMSAVLLLGASPAVALDAARRESSKRPLSSNGLWSVYQSALSTAKYIDLTHTLKPATPVWHGFQTPQIFEPSINPDNGGKPYTYNVDGFEATRYQLSTDQYGTQLDPPAHWDPYYPAIDELPATFAVRPLVCISIVEQVSKDAGYQMQVSDIEDWEKQYGRIPEGSVVMIRSDFYKRWEEPNFPEIFPFPGVTLDALKYLHEERHILFHGHEALDTDTTKTLEGESWLMHHGYTQAEGVKNLDKVAPKGCLINMGYPKFAGGTGGYARYVAICPSEWPHGTTIAETAGPLPKYKYPLVWNEELGYRTRQHDEET